VFERFTDRARRVVVLAQEESRALGHDYIGTEHLLLGLVSEGDGIAGRALASFDVSHDRVQAKVVELVGPGRAVQVGHIPFRPRAKQALERALREALALGHNYIGTEHLLLGVLRVDDCAGVQVLVGLGVDLGALRTRLVELLSEMSEASDVGASADLPPLQLAPELQPPVLAALTAMWKGDLGRVEEQLGRAVRSAQGLHDTTTLDSLATIVEIVDASTGEVRLRPRPSREA
jgi:ATP-dependent Clp protease ATP-binding subunit ClpA